MDRRLIFLPDRIGDNNICSQRNSDKQVEQQTNDRAVSANRSHADSLGIPSEITDDRQIGCIKKLLQNSCCCYRKCIKDQFIP